MIPAMSGSVPTVQSAPGSEPAPGGRRSPLARLAALTPSGRARVPIAWALYDFSDTIFSAAIISTAIGLWLTAPERLGNDAGQLAVSLTVVVSVGLNALVSPVLGALSDRGGRRLPFLLFFTIFSIVPMALIGPTPPLVGAALFAVANFAYQAELIYYDATLASVSTPASRGALSGLGVGVGYMGTIFAAVVLLLLGSDRPEQIFPIAAVLIAIFAAPIFLIVRETPVPNARPVGVRDLAASVGQLRATIGDARLVPGLPRFLLGRFFYTDAVNTIVVVMSVMAVRAMGFTQKEFLLILLMLTVIAIVMAFVWGRVVDRIGPKRTLMIVLATWVVGLAFGVTALGMSGTTPGNVLFLAAGAVVGSGLGGVHVSDRVFMIRLSPREKLGEFFGLFGLVGKGSQVVGQTFYGVIVFLFYDRIGNGAYQLAVVSLVLTMLVGAWCIRPVSDHWRGRTAERASRDDAPEVVGEPVPVIAA